MKHAFKAWILLSLTTLSVLSLMLFSVCTGERDNPLDIHNPNHKQPSIDVDTTGDYLKDRDTIYTDTATIKVTGNDALSRFKAIIDNKDSTEWQDSSTFIFRYSSLASGKHSVVIRSKYEGWENVESKTITFLVRSKTYTAKALTSFSFTNPAVAGMINETAKTIAVTVPYGTNVSALVATFTTNGASVNVSSTVQVSGTTPNNFTSPVTYTVTAADNSTQDYIVTVTVSPNTAKALTSFSFANPAVLGEINESAKTVAVTVPYGTNVTALVASFVSSGASVKVSSAVQVSGSTANDFTSPLTYTITAADNSTQDYIVTVTVSPDTAKALTSFSFANLAVLGEINESAKTVAVTVPYGTNVTALAAAFTLTGSSVKIGSAAQVSGITTNNFTNSVTYTVTAADNSTQDYVVTVTIAPYVFTVTFDDQGATVGSKPSTKTVAAPATTVDTLPVNPQRENYKFDGWYTGTNGSGTAFTGSTEVKQSMTVYAKWTPVFTVTYKANGGTGMVPVDTNKYQNGQTVSVLDAGPLSRTNYTFAGWNTQADTLGKDYGVTFPMGSANVVLYAKWRLKPILRTQPISQTCPVNDSVTFTVIATGANLSYQWQKNGVDIGGATKASYTPTLMVDDIVAVATYRCVVSNAGGSATSTGATLTVSMLTDIEGNVYHQVKIGNQIWTMENFRSTKFNDGDTIPQVIDSAAWSSLVTPAFCYYNNLPSNKDKYGALYTWYTVNTGKLAPDGWHVPSDAEWTTFENYLIANGYNWDGTTTDNKIAKSLAAQTDWNSSTTAGAIGNNLTSNNKSGFSALGGGYRGSDRYLGSNGSFGDLRDLGHWWSASEAAGSKDGVWSRSLSINSYGLDRGGSYKSYGRSVRLVRD